jgi:hypothetical protein
MYLGAVDIGFEQDYTALMICEFTLTSTSAAYVCCHLERLPLPTKLPDVVAHVHGLFGPPPWSSRDVFFVDITGVGNPVYHAISQTGVAPLGLFAHAGSETTWKENVWRVPKKDLVSSALLVVESHRLQLPTNIPMTQLMVEELLNYRRQQDLTTGHESYAAGRDATRPHDDLVFCVGMICWWGERLARSRPPTLVLERALQGTAMPRQHTNTSDRPLRPRLGRLRVFEDVLAEEPSDLDWDRVKHDVAEGKLVPPGPYRPERAP